MGVFAGPEITESGLVLALDAANNKSILSAVEVLVVAGGGGGGSFNGGGGGAGGLIYSSIHTITPGSAITAIVGNGGVGDGRPGNGASGASGAVGTNGGNSVFGSLTAIGGGVGASYSVRTDGVSGGSGGGSWGSLTFASGTAGQGNAGGGGYPIGNNYTETAGGGGGAGSNGVNGGTSSNQPGAGGLGLLLNISGNAQFYAAGGAAGANRLGGSALGGSGIGGNGGTTASVAGVAGVSNTGSGGGGAAYNGFPGSSADGGAGGSGIVIVRYPGSQRATGGTVTSVGGHTIHTFTTSGTFTPNGAPGTGTIWTDFSNNGNSGTLVNGVSYTENNRGALVFDGVDDYVLISSSISYSEYTFMFFCRWISSVGVSERIFGSDGFGTYTIFNPSDVGFHYNPLGNSPPSVVLSSGVNIGFGTWCQVAVTVSTSNTLVRIYVNGVLRNSSSILPSQNLIGNLFIGSQNTLYRSNCNVSNFNLYNRALTAAEILQNFNALRGRYGI